MSTGFHTNITRHGQTLQGPVRQPKQMLAEQEYGGHLSIHDDQTAEQLGFKAGPIEGPTHFSQFDPLLASIWGDDLEIRMINGPLFVGAPYQLSREIVTLSESPRTESYWVKSTIRDAADDIKCEVLLNHATLKDSYAGYPKE